MKVYLVQTNADRFQSLEPADHGSATTEMLYFDGRPKAATWSPPAVYVDRPLLPAPDFWCLAPAAALAVEPHALEHVQTQFEMAGELLPLPFQGRELTVLNITECIDCLDEERSKWIVTKEGKRVFPNPLMPGTHVFRPERMSESSLFKIPQTSMSFIFCAEWEGDPEMEFKAAVEEHGLKGLRFREVWSSE